MALVSCPYCGHQISDKANRCPLCGNNPQKKSTQNTSIKTIVIACIVMAVLIAGGILAYLLLQKKSDLQLAENTQTYQEAIVEEPVIEEPIVEEVVAEEDDIDYYEDVSYDDLEYYEYEFVENAVKEVLQLYCDAIANNDFNTLNQIYAPYVERFHDAYNEEKSKVIDRHRNYDKTFKVHGKSSHIRWETFEMKIEDERIYAVIVEDYSIDREDKSKYSNFVLEKHFVLDDDFQVVSVWDNQLSRSK